LEEKHPGLLCDEEGKISASTHGAVGAFCAWDTRQKVGTKHDKKLRISHLYVYLAVTQVVRGGRASGESSLK
jgi:hypothetical protein